MDTELFLKPKEKLPSQDQGRREGAEKRELSGDMQFIASILPSANVFMLW